MRRTLVWLLIVVALVLYSVVVYSWWKEGDANFERQRREHDNAGIYLPNN